MYHHRLCSATPLDWLLSRNLKPRKLSLRAFLDFPRKLAPTKITRHMVTILYQVGTATMDAHVRSEDNNYCNVQLHTAYRIYLNSSHSYYYM